MKSVKEKHDCNFFYGKTIELDMHGNKRRMKYCPVCGGILGLNNALSLKDLRKQISKPVFVICNEFPDLNGWYVVHLDKQTNRVECWGYDSIVFRSHNYNDDWLAYISEKRDGEGKTVPLRSLMK